MKTETKYPVIKWTATKAETAIIGRIAERAERLCLKGKYPRIEILMDLEACHCNGCPLDLERLLNAEDYDFCHDVFGIRRHINRRTGQLEDCFVPRFALP